MNKIHPSISQSDIIVVVVTYNRPKLLKKVVDAVKLQTILPSKVVVIDNNSDQPLSPWFQKQPLLEIHRLSKNIGGAGGFSKGIKIASSYNYKWIWLLDDDAIPDVDALENLLIAAQRNNNVGAICSTIFEGGIKAEYHHGFFCNLTGKRTFLKNDPICKAKEVSIDTGSFASMLLSVSVVTKIGLPHEDYFLGYDDTEYCLRIKKFGFSVLLSNSSLVHHLGTPLNTQPFGRKHYYHIRNHAFMLNEYMRSGVRAFIASSFFALKVWINSREKYSSSAIFFLFLAWANGITNRRKLS